MTSGYSNNISHNMYYKSLIEQGDSDSEVIICFVSNSVDLLQLLKFITGWGFSLRHCHKPFVD